MSSTRNQQDRVCLRFAHCSFQARSSQTFRGRELSLEFSKDRDGKNERNEIGRYEDGADDAIYNGCCPYHGAEIVHQTSLFILRCSGPSIFKTGLTFEGAV